MHEENIRKKRMRLWIIGGIIVALMVFAGVQFLGADFLGVSGWRVKDWSAGGGSNSDDLTYVNQEYPPASSSSGDAVTQNHDQSEYVSPDVISSSSFSPPVSEGGDDSDEDKTQSERVTDTTLPSSSQNKQEEDVTNEITASPVSITPEDASSLKEATQFCSFPAPSSGSRKIIFNEIAWMGSPSDPHASSTSTGSRNEWIELRNISSDAVSLEGWQIENRSGRIKIDLSGNGSLEPGSFFVLVHSGSSDSSSGTIGYFSGDLSNAGDTLALLNVQCEVSDYLDASAGWPAGNNTTKQTMERDRDAEGWHTSALPGGTPGNENSSVQDATSSFVGNSLFKLIVAFEGEGSGTITSDPAGLVCGDACTGEYASGTTVILKAQAHEGYQFLGWSDPCYGESVCTVTLHGARSLSAQFKRIPSSSEGNEIAPLADPSSSTASAVDSGALNEHISSGTELSMHPIIVAVQIAGASSSNDVVKLFNPLETPFDIGGWKLRKRSSSGKEYSLKEFLSSTTIPAGGYYVWANSLGGFSDSLNADASSSETLSSDNSVAIIDAHGAVIDQLAWGSGTDQYREGSAYPDDPPAGQVLTRKSSGGQFSDTNDNAEDFFLAQ